MLKKIKNLSMLITALIFVAGCASFPKKDIQIDTQSDPKVNFSGYKSYAWVGTAAILNDPYGQWELPNFDADAEITFLIDRELRKRGMSENSSDPDLLIAYAAGIDMEALKLKIDPETSINILENVPQGGLVLLFVDSETSTIIWRGVAIADVLENPDMETSKARLDYAVTKMLKKLPK